MINQLNTFSYISASLAPIYCLNRQTILFEFISHKTRRVFKNESRCLVDLVWNTFIKGHKVLFVIAPLVVGNDVSFLIACVVLSQIHSLKPPQNTVFTIFLVLGYCGKIPIIFFFA